MVCEQQLVLQTKQIHNILKHRDFEYHLFFSDSMSRNTPSYQRIELSDLRDSYQQDIDEDELDRGSLWSRIKPYTIVLFISITFICSIIMIFFYGTAKSIQCAPAPFLYVTMHDAPHNVMKFSRDGCLLDKRVLHDGLGLLKSSELRSMKVGNYQGHQALFVVNAKTKRDSVLIYSHTCNKLTGKRKFLGIAASSFGKHAEKLLQHPYSVTFDEIDNMYVSCQHSDMVLRFRYSHENHSYVPMPLLTPAKSHSNKHQMDEKYDISNSSVASSNHSHPRDVVTIDTGKVTINKTIDSPVFVDFNDFNTAELKITKDGVRDLLWLDNELWVAHEDLNAVCIFNKFGELLRMIPIDRPITMFYDPHSITKHDVYSEKSINGRYLRKQKRGDDYPDTSGTYYSDYSNDDDYDDDFNDDDDDAEETETEPDADDTYDWGEHDGIVFVGSKQRHHRGVVVAINVRTYSIEQRYHHRYASHPTGIVTYHHPHAAENIYMNNKEYTVLFQDDQVNDDIVATNDISYRDILYVADQVSENILLYNIPDGTFIGTIAKKLPIVENMYLSDC